MTFLTNSLYQPAKEPRLYQAISGADPAYFGAAQFNCALGLCMHITGRRPANDQPERTGLRETADFSDASRSLVEASSKPVFPASTSLYQASGGGWKDLEEANFKPGVPSLHHQALRLRASVCSTNRRQSSLNKKNSIGSIPGYRLTGSRGTWPIDRARADGRDDTGGKSAQTPGIRSESPRITDELSSYTFLVQLHSGYKPSIPSVFGRLRQCETFASFYNCTSNCCFMLWWFTDCAILRNPSFNAIHNIPELQVPNYNPTDLRSDFSSLTVLQPRNNRSTISLNPYTTL
ncbi:hypothetical protein Bbelb_204300 [Branchiostoma belcheri]|nr:hypothetical protein Bbelb_204300 [Branchiostoma belcheri]